MSSDKIKVFIKQLFCSHIWDITDTKSLGYYKKTTNCGAMIDVDTYKRTALYKKCLKCNKEIITERTELWI